MSDKIDVNYMLDEFAFKPEKAHEADAGFDIRLPRNQHIVVSAHGNAVVDTGVHLEIPIGYVGFLKSKSGLNVRDNITGEGVIDSGYTGSIVVKLYNNGDVDVPFASGQKLIQIVIIPIPDVEMHEVNSFAETERGDNGFGSTGR